MNVNGFYVGQLVRPNPKAADYYHGHDLSDDYPNSDVNRRSMIVGTVHEIDVRIGAGPEGQDAVSVHVIDQDGHYLCFAERYLESAEYLIEELP